MCACPQAKHRARFFQLVDVFLASGLVPAYTAAAFAKRFARLALAAPPAGAAVAVAFVHNLLRRHPACNILLHRHGFCARSQSLPCRNGKDHGKNSSLTIIAATLLRHLHRTDECHVYTQQYIHTYIADMVTHVNHMVQATTADFDNAV